MTGDNTPQAAGGKSAVKKRETVLRETPVTLSPFLVSH
jgi:hypothetical protein